MSLLREEQLGITLTWCSARGRLASAPLERIFIGFSVGCQLLNRLQSGSIRGWPSPQRRDRLMKYAGVGTTDLVGQDGWLAAQDG